MYSKNGGRIIWYYYYCHPSASQFRIGISRAWRWRWIYIRRRDHNNIIHSRLSCLGDDKIDDSRLTTIVVLTLVMTRADDFGARSHFSRDDRRIRNKIWFYTVYAVRTDKNISSYYIRAYRNTLHVFRNRSVFPFGETSLCRLNQSSVSHPTE